MLSMRRAALPIGLLAGSLVAVSIAVAATGAAEIALAAVAVTALVAAHLARWRARRALFDRTAPPGDGPGPDGDRRGAQPARPAPEGADSHTARHPVGGQRR